MSRVALGAVLLGSVQWASGQVAPTTCIYTDISGKTVNFGPLWQIDGTPVTSPTGTPLPIGNIKINPCSKVDCPGASPPIQSSCCLTTSAALGGRTESCGSSPAHTFTSRLEFDMPKTFVVGYIAKLGSTCNALKPMPKLQVTIAFDCDPTALPPPAKQKLTANPLTYMKYDCNLNLTWATSLVCVLPPAPAYIDPTAGNFGKFFLLAFFLGFAGYCGLGYVGLSLVMRKRGTNAIPQYEFWAAMPALLQDGVKFAIGGFKKEGSSLTTPIQGDEDQME